MIERLRLRDQDEVSSSTIVLPRLPAHRPTAKVKADYELAVLRFCRQIKELKSGLDFEVSSRGWCYILEEHGLRKNEFDTAQRLINDCRKNGNLPVNICAEDEARAFENLQDLDEEDPEEFARGWIDYLSDVHLDYTPFSFWESQKYYVQTLVEKVDLKSLFSPICEEFHIPIANVGGWADLRQRTDLMQRFKYWEARRKKCVLLYCGDHDPGGLNISNFLRSNLEDMAGAEGVGWTPEKLIIDRFGLNYDFIQKHRLTWIDNLATAGGKYPLDHPKHPDHYKPYVQNYLKRFKARKVEANALVVRPEAGRQLCRDAILKYVPATAPQTYQRKLRKPREAARVAIARRILEDL
jgi:hypothetical protein